MVGPWIVKHAPLFLLAKIGFGVISICELLSPLCLVSNRFRWFWIAVMVPFHFLSLLTMNIFFWENMLLILFFATDSNRFFASRRGSG